MTHGLFSFSDDSVAKMLTYRLADCSWAERITTADALLPKQHGVWKNAISNRRFRQHISYLSGMSIADF
jgi:hypothetical protein